MAGEWSVVAFEKIFATPLRNGLTRPKRVRGEGIPMVNMGELFAHPRLHDVEMDRVPLSEREAAFLLEPGDLLFARQSLVLEGAGKCSIFLGNNEPTTFESHLIRARIDRHRADPLFYYYFFSSPSGRQAISSIVEQVAAAGIRGSDLARLEIPYPPINEQQAIACILGTLDDKIELNRRINQTLEEIAQAIFRSWFIDFDPVRAKAAGQQPVGLAPQIAELFPESFEDSEIGEVPVGWSSGTIGDVAENPRRGLAPQQIMPGTPYIGLEHMPRRSIALGEWEVDAELASGKFAFQKGEILFGKLRPYFHKVGVAPVDGVCSTDILVVTPKSPEWFGFVLGHVSSTDFVNHTNAGSTGTKMPRTNWDDMSRYSVAVPSEPVAAAFNTTVRPMVERIIASIHESRALGLLRDALLPKLVSGELLLSEAERIIERCGS